jgi:hypothetical protein
MMGKFIKTYGNLFVNLTASTTDFTANTVTGGLLMGNIDSSFIGTGTSISNRSNFVTNDEFIRLTGLTGYVQTQIDNKSLNSSPYLTVGSTPTGLTNSKIISAGTNTRITTSILNGYMIQQWIGALEFGSIKISTSGDSNYSINDLSPTGWNDSYPNRALQIKIEPLCVLKLTGLVGGADGRMATITNVGNFLIIIENLSNNSNSDNTFLLSNKTSYFLNKNSSINFLYNNNIKKWVQNLSYPTNEFLIFDDYNNSLTNTVNTVLISGTSLPASTYSTIVFSGGNQVGTTSIPGFRSNPNNPTGAIELYKTFSNSSANSTSSIGIGPYRFISNYESTTGSCLTVISKFTSIKKVTPFLGPQDNWAVVVGTENSRMINNYSAITSNNTTFPSFSGGSFWLFDYSGNPQYARFAVQDTSNSSIVKNSTFNLLDITGNTYKTFGVYSTTQSGSSFGTSTFFWCINSGVSENYIIEPPIFKTGGTIQGNPSLNFYGAYNYSGNSFYDNVSKIVVDSFAFDFKKL